ncbi:MAG: PilZ domain-containing protein [Candidatus Omnitrophota bacterium]
MEQKNYSGIERRQFVRIDFSEPLQYKVCKAETITKLFDGYTQNISQSGLLCKLKEPIPIEAILWLSFDMNVLTICKEIESRSLIIQKGVLGKVVRVVERQDGCFDVGICFLTRDEKEDFIELCNRLNKQMR